MKLTDRTIASLPFGTGQRDYSDEAVRGLAVRVGVHTKTFMLMTQRGSHRTRVKLGVYPDLSLSAARTKARDLLAQQRIARTETPSVRFDDALETYYRVQGTQRRAITSAEAKRLLDKHFRPTLGKRRLETIKPADIVPVLDGLLHSPAIRRNAFVFLRAFFNWSYRRGYIETSPVARIERPAPSKPRDRVLTSDELRRIWYACPDTDYGSIIKLCILSGQRIGQWMHFENHFVDADKMVITWAAEAMKADKVHTLPLTPMVAAILATKDNLEIPFDWKMDGRCKRRLDKRSGVHGWVQHDLRRTWATISAENLDTPPHIIEAVLAHQNGSRVARTYNRAQYLAPMRNAMIAFEEWLYAFLADTEVMNDRNVS
jgi:integrase